MTTEPPRSIDKAMAFPEPRAATRQYDETTLMPQPNGPAPSAGGGERRSTQDRGREAPASRGLVMADAADRDVAPNGDDIAVTSGEAIRAFGNRS